MKMMEKKKKTINGQLKPPPIPVTVFLSVFKSYHVVSEEYSFSGQCLTVL